MAERSHPGNRGVGPATRAVRRAAGLDGRDAGGDAGRDRVARPRIRAWLRLHGRSWAPSGRGRSSVVAPGPECGQRFHPGRADQRSAAATRGIVRFRRPRADVSGYPAGLLVGRKPVSSPPGSQPVASSIRATGYGGGQRAVLDRNGAARRYRAADHGDAGARRSRRQPQRPQHARHAPGSRAVRRGARRLRHLLRSRRSARIRRALSRESHSAGMAPLDVRHLE